MGTIVQEYGPIYGEPVNGTVSGRPNGSVFVPIINTIEASLADAYRYITNASLAGRVAICNSSGAESTYQSRNVTVVAIAQDLASNVQLQVYDDSDCTNLIASQQGVAGNFNDWFRRFVLVDPDYVLVDGTTYYLRAQLLNNGVPVATTEVIELVGVVPA